MLLRWNISPKTAPSCQPALKTETFQGRANFVVTAVTGDYRDDTASDDTVVIMTTLFFQCG